VVKYKLPQVEMIEEKEGGFATRYVILKSKRNHNLTIMYDGNTIMLPPHGKTPRLESARLGTLPSGVLRLEVP